MRSIFSAALVATLGNAILPVIAEFTGLYPGQPTDSPDAGLGIGQIQDMGCYASVPNFIEAGYYLYQTDGWCNAWCARNHYQVSANSNGSDCWCGTALPSDSDQTSPSSCDTPCFGYKSHDCEDHNFRKYSYPC